jgi:hypothetical protein
LPPLKTPLKTSVYRICGLGGVQVAFMGNTVALERRKELFGRVDLFVSDVLRAGLRVAPTLWPFRHADLVQWPTDKGERKSITQELAAAAVLRLVS